MPCRRAVAGFVAVWMGTAGAGAVDLSGLVGVSYDHTSSGDVGAYGGAGGVLFAFGNPGFQTQLSGGGEHVSASGVSADAYYASGDLFWRDRKGTFGVTLTYHSLSAGLDFNGSHIGGSASIESYGVFGEYYFNRSLTFRFRGGGYSGDFSGYYGGVGAAFYPGHDIALAASYDYISASGGHSSVPGASLEVLPYQPWPVTVALNYAHESSGSGSDIIGVALKWHFGAGGADIRTLDRTGPIQWNGALPL